MPIIKHKPLNLIGMALTLFSLTACIPRHRIIQNDLVGSKQTTDRQKTIVLADIANNPQQKIRKFQPLVNYLAANLANYDRGKVKIAPDLETMIAWLKSGEVDIFIDSPYPAMLAINDANAKPILRRWTKGSAEYYSLIFTMSDRNIKSLVDLRGKTIAFDHPASTTGYILPLAKLQEVGLHPRKKISLQATVDEDQVGYIFSQQQKNSVEWLLSHKVAAVAINNRAFEKISPQIKNNIIVLAESEKIARNLVLVSQTVSADEVDAISSVLLNMNKTKEGKAILAKFSQTNKFDRFPTTESLDKIETLYQATQDQ